MKPARKVQLLRQIRTALEHEENPTARAVGLAVEEFQELANEGLLDIWIVDDAEDILSNHRIHALTDAGAGVLAQAGAAGAPLFRAQVHSEKQPLPAKAARLFAKGIWELVKVGFGVALGWYLKKYFG